MVPKGELDTNICLDKWCELQDFISSQIQFDAKYLD
jgi:hypothetical protein